MKTVWIRVIGYIDPSMVVEVRVRGERVHWFRSKVENESDHPPIELSIDDDVRPGDILTYARDAMGRWHGCCFLSSFMNHTLRHVKIVNNGYYEFTADGVMLCETLPLVVPLHAQIPLDMPDGMVARP